MGLVCKQCGAREVEAERECYATPMCFACLPPPKPLPKTYTQQHVDELTRERDEARAEVERLQTASVASVDRWMEFVSHFQRLVRSNMGTEAGKLAIGYFKRAAETGNLDEAGPPTVTPRDAAASERAAIVAMLDADAVKYFQGAMVPDRRSDAFRVNMRGGGEALERAVKKITRLDHHRDGGEP